MPWTKYRIITPAGAGFLVAFLRLTMIVYKFNPRRIAAIMLVRGQRT